MSRPVQVRARAVALAGPRDGQDDPRRYEHHSRGELVHVNIENLCASYQQLVELAGRMLPAVRQWL